MRGLCPGLGADPAAPASPAELPGSASELPHIPGCGVSGSALVSGHRARPSSALGLLGEVPALLVALAVPGQPADQDDPLQVHSF